MVRINISIIISSLIAASFGVQAAVSVFACEPEWASLTKAIGGAHVRVVSATHARQNPHYIRARPSLIAAIRRAELLVCSGASLEAGWLPVLLKRASSELQPGGVGYLMATDHVAVLETPTTVDRSMGDVHPEGNPHVHLNPNNLIQIGRRIKEQLQKIDPDNKAVYAKRYADFERQWAVAIQRWTVQAAPLRGQTVIVHHKSLSYLLDWLGINTLASLEPVPGLPPTASHLNTVLKDSSRQPVLAILRTPYDPSDASEWMASKTRIPSVVVPYTVGGSDQSTDLKALFNHTIELLLMHGS
jgi:zinc/manganese transport system substrate-binding protein